VARNTIDQFMWGWQAHFRIDVQVTLERALEVAGARLDPQVFLIGFATDPGSARHPICIEPETGPLSPRQLGEVEERTIEIFRSDPETRIMNTDRELHNSRQRWLHRRSRGSALAEAVSAAGVFQSKEIVCSSAGLVSGYEVHTCVALDQGPLALLPRLEGEDVNRFPAPSSFVRHIVGLVLREADIALNQQDPGIDAIRRRSEDMVIEAADNFIAGCSYRARSFRSPHLLEAMNQIAQRAYEGREASGRLILAAPDDPAIEVTARLRNPVSMRASRAVRKLLETTKSGIALLAHDGKVYGFGRVHDLTSPSVFEIDVTAHATWEVRHNGVGLVRLSYRTPGLPSPTFDAGRLQDTLARVFRNECDLAKLVSLVGAAVTARHGTTLVVSGAAQGEAERLSEQATLIDPIELSPETLSDFAQIDGAVLLDPAGVCHALGVILDGLAGGEGDPGRGARFNSASRYQQSSRASSVLVVISEDGDVTQIPDLMPMVRRQDVLDALTLLRASAESGDPGRFSEAYGRIEELAFYLAPEECDIVNALVREEEGRARTTTGMTILRKPIQPNPLLDESYFLKDPV
jgi:hypothetical protein